MVPPSRMMCMIAGYAWLQASTTAGLKMKESNQQADLKSIFQTIFKWAAGLTMLFPSLFFVLNLACHEV
jgi:hypothetical protein